MDETEKDILPSDGEQVVEGIEAPTPEEVAQAINERDGNTDGD